jgi:hypothetical protein
VVVAKVWPVFACQLDEVIEVIATFAFAGVRLTTASNDTKSPVVKNMRRCLSVTKRKNEDDMRVEFYSIFTTGFTLGKFVTTYKT